MQFEAPSTHQQHHHNHHGHSTMNTDYTMYLPGMGRIPTKPIVSIQRKNIVNDNKNDLKKGMSPISSLKKPIDQKLATLDRCEIDPAMDDAESKVIHYRVWPGGPIKTFLPSIRSEKTNSAAIILQKMVRGKCARTNYYVQKMERHIQRMNEQRIRDLQAVHENKETQKMLVRRKATLKQATLVKVQLDTKKTASQGSELINYLRKENKKLRQKNDKIAASIAALRLHNEQLENLTSATGENQNILGTHYEKIEETNALLVSVVPQYESKIVELREALEVRQQYCDVENHMKVLYMKLIGTVTEMMEQDSNDPELIQEIMQFCADLPSDMISVAVVAPVASTTTTTQSDNSSSLDVEYDEVSVVGCDDGMNQEDEDDSDSNNYDDYTIASMD